MADASNHLESLKPKTLAGIKSLAKHLKKRDGISHMQALEVAALRAGFASYREARCAFEGGRDD